MNLKNNYILVILNNYENLCEREKADFFFSRRNAFPSYTCYENNFTAFFFSRFPSKGNVFRGQSSDSRVFFFLFLLFASLVYLILFKHRALQLVCIVRSSRVFLPQLHPRLPSYRPLIANSSLNRRSLNRQSLLSVPQRTFYGFDNAPLITKGFITIVSPSEPFAYSA